MSSCYNVLLIDDDDDLVEALTTILEVKGFNVRRASNGKEGLETLKKNELPDIIVLDIMMDTMDEGINVAREIKSQDNWSAIPIIGLSAINNELPVEIEVHEEMYPVDLFMEKPVAPEKFISEIKRLIGK